MNNQLQTTTNNGLSIITSEVDRKALSNLLPGERKMIEAALQPKINAQPAVDVVSTFVSIVTTAYTRAGFKMPDEATVFIYADEFYSALMEKYPKVTIPEVREALKEGVYGEYGEFTGLNPKTFMQFVKAFLFSKERKEAMLQFENKRSVLMLQNGMTQEQREESNKEYVNFLFEDHLKGSLLVDYVPAFLYDFLEQQEKIRLTTEEKKAINEKAKSYFTRLKTSKRYKGTARRVDDVLSDYVESRDEKLTVVNISKQFAVVDFFEATKLAGHTTIFPKLLPNG